MRRAVHYLAIDGDRALAESFHLRNTAPSLKKVNLFLFLSSFPSTQKECIQRKMKS